MRQFLVLLAILAAAGLGFLAGKGQFGTLGLGIRASKSTVIKLKPGAGGQCVSETKDKHLKAKRLTFIEWAIDNTDCQLSNGGVVQLRFTTTSPVFALQPVQSANGDASIVDTTLQNAAFGSHEYKVWAHFPTGDGDYEMEDPDLEIVEFSFY